MTTTPTAALPPPVPAISPLYRKRLLVNRFNMVVSLGGISFKTTASPVADYGTIDLGPTAAAPHNC